MLSERLSVLLVSALLCGGSSASDPTCAKGIKYSGNPDVCCDSKCGRCGGHGCGGLPGGSARCCGGAISKANRSCSKYDAPCVIGSGGGGGGAQCTLQVGIEYLGDDVSPPTPTKDEPACCAACAADKSCKFFTYEGGTDGLCHHKNTDAPDYSRHNASCTSGYVGVTPPTPSAPKDVSVAVGDAISPGGANHVCWNIDASANRGFFWRNLSTDDPSSYGSQLARQAAALGEAQTAGFSLLRFGGSGNDYLTYAFGGTKCPELSEYKQCLNVSTWKALLGFTAASKAKMIFGISMNTGKDYKSTADSGRSGDFPYPWDPTNARQILQWTIDNQLDHLIYGFELGNEQNSKYTGAQTATDFQILHNLTLDLWPDETRRPVLFGPDPHSLHAPSGDQLAWIASWLDGCKNLGVPVHAVTHHEYIEVDPTPSGFASAAKLSLNGAIAAAINRTVRAHSADARIFGGEIGPHNGGSPPCDHTSMRWATFGDSLWYADALAAKAKFGYSGLCRQDYIGGDYGMVDCLTGAPLPDYYTALLWTRLMGPKVLSVTATASAASGGAIQPAENSTVRVYAHCTRSTTLEGAVTILAINLGGTATTLHFDTKDDSMHAYVLSPGLDAAGSLTHQAGLMGTAALLNGKLLTLGSDGSVPPTPAVVLPRGGGVVVSPASVAFFVLPNAGHAEC